MGRIKGKPHSVYKLAYLVPDWESGATLEKLAQRHGCTKQGIENAMRRYVKRGIADRSKRDEAIAVRPHWRTKA